MITEVQPSFLIELLVKLGVVASIASILARFRAFQAVLLQDSRTLKQRVILALWLSAVFGASVAPRVLSPSYAAADLGMEGSFLAGLLGGYVTGLISGLVISLPAFIKHEHLTMPALAAMGVLGGLLRDLAPEPEDIWRMSPFPDLSIYRFLKENQNPRRAAFHLSLLAAILTAEFVRQHLSELTSFRPTELFRLAPPSHQPHPLTYVAQYATAVFAVLIPVKMWDYTRTEKKLEEQKRLLVEARLAALTSQINPHFLFNTLNSVSSLIRTDPAQARVMVLNLSRVLRRLLRKHENFSPLREELSFIQDYLSIELMRFGDKLRLETDVENETLDLLVPSMLLQPLVENSIKHGLSSKVEGGTISIRTRRRDSKLVVSVEDDGAGIPEARLPTLLEHGIGVSNVNERLKVLFGDGYRMWIDSEPGRGTRIEIEIPELVAGLAAAS